MGHFIVKAIAGNNKTYISNFSPIIWTSELKFAKGLENKDLLLSELGYNLDVLSALFKYKFIDSLYILYVDDKYNIISEENITLDDIPSSFS